MPHFIDFKPTQFREVLEQIPQEKIILLDHKIEEVEYFSGLIYQDFKSDIYDALVKALDLLNKDNKITLVFPENQNYPYPKEIIIGFRKFCSFHQIEFQVINEISPTTSLAPGSAYVVIEEIDLVNLIKQVRQAGLKLGKDIGILSYNDTPLKEVLEDGISVITTDFTKMGALAAEIILKNNPVQIKNDFNLIVRNSL